MEILGLYQIPNKHTKKNCHQNHKTNKPSSTYQPSILVDAMLLHTSTNLQQPANLQEPRGPSVQIQSGATILRVAVDEGPEKGIAVPHHAVRWRSDGGQMAVSAEGFLGAIYIFIYLFICVHDFNRCWID